MKIKATSIKSKELVEGDLFSNVGQLYWSEENLKIHEKLGAVGQKVYIRTNSPLTPEQANEIVYKIEIEL